MAMQLPTKFAVTTSCDHSGFVSAHPQTRHMEETHHSPTNLHLTGRAMNSRPSSRIIQYFRKRFMVVVLFCRRGQVLDHRLGAVALLAILNRTRHVVVVLLLFGFDLFDLLLDTFRLLDKLPEALSACVVYGLSFIGSCRLNYSAAVDGQFADFAGQWGIRLAAQSFPDGLTGNPEKLRQLDDLPMFYKYSCHKINYFRIFVAKVPFETSM
nr:MAG TPA: hypothetical protein [Caudoviricetes sp.]